MKKEDNIERDFDDNEIIELCEKEGIDGMVASRVLEIESNYIYKLGRR